MEVKWIKLRQ